MSLSNVIEDLQGWYNDSMEKADPRVENLPLAQSPWPVALILVLYLSVVHYGQKLMEPFKPLQLRGILIVYNILMVLMSLFIFGLTLDVALREKYSLVCQLVDYTDTPTAFQGVMVGWLFFFSKLIELMDTVFFILRKKSSQISFLHVYHHTTIVVVTWSGMKWVPGGQAFAYPLVNSLVHVVMYSYYCLAAIGPHMQKYLWWKRYLTRFQLVQFALILTHTAVNLFADCAFPKLFDILLFLYAVTILILFLNFYFKAYIQKKRPVHASENGKMKNGRMENGRMENGKKSQ